MNLGRADRTLRVVSALTLIVAAVMAPIPLAASLALGATALYMGGSSLVGTCLGYKLIGVSTCPVSRA
jgi:Protein of unknown function (DUF2892)